MLRPMGRSEAETSLEREGNCAHSPLLRPSQDNSDLVVEQCGLGEVRPHLQGVSIPTLPVVDLGTEHAAHEALARPRIEETHAIVAHEDTMIAEWISLTEEGDELESGVRVADDDPSDDGAPDDGDVDHGWCGVRHSVVALPNDCPGHEVENSSQDESVPEEFGNKSEVVVSPSVSTCPSLAAGLERDETVERNEQSNETGRLPRRGRYTCRGTRRSAHRYRQRDKSWQCSRRRPNSEVEESHHGPKEGGKGVELREAVLCVRTGHTAAVQGD